MHLLYGRSVRSGMLLVAASLLFACTGDQGPPGPQGDTGATGDTGAAGPAGSSVVPVDTAESINVEVMSVSFPSGTERPSVTLRLTNDVGFGLTGLPAANIRFTIAQLTAGQNLSPSEWQSYVTRDSAGIPDAQATTETATAGDYTDNNDGTYDYVFEMAPDSYPAGPVFSSSKTHRLGIEIRTNSGGFLPFNIPANNAPYDFLPTGGAPTETRLIVNNDTCNACHDNLEFHGAARFDVEYCVTCHNPFSIDGDTVAEAWGGTVDMKRMVHKIHNGIQLANGYFIVGHNNNVHDYSNIIFSQDVRNCQTCHQESDPTVPQASNWRTVPNQDACGACHDEIDWSVAGPTGHPGDLMFVDDSQCIDCHGENSTVNNGELKVDFVHRILTLEESEKFSYNILGVTNTAVGETPIIRFSVTDPTTLADPALPPEDGDPYDIKADSEWTTCAQGASRLAIGIAWDTDDYQNRDSGNSPSLPISINPLSACGGASTTLGGGEFSVPSPIPVPATASGTLAVTMEGHPAVDIGGVINRIAVTNAVAYAVIDDLEVEPRRNAVNISKCQDCHKQLSIHGNNRTDNVEVCVTCHAPNATDVNRRGGQCLIDLGPGETAIDFKYMVHAIHASGEVDVPYEVCGFGNSTHIFDFDYPGKLNNCEGCHNPGAYYPVDSTAVLGTTVSTGLDPIVTTDDVVVSPNTSVCSGCHVSSLATEHMTQNGGDFAATKMADGTLSSSSVETCELCHGPGRTADVGVMHGISTFESN